MKLNTNREYKALKQQHTDKKRRNILKINLLIFYSGTDRIRQTQGIEHSSTLLHYRWSALTTIGHLLC